LKIIYLEVKKRNNAKNPFYDVIQVRKCYFQKEKIKFFVEGLMLMLL
jgi:hypothetical protein